jgi:AsmA protein
VRKTVVTAPVGIRRLALAAIALVVAGFCAVLIVPFLMPAEVVRDAVKAEIHAVTGLDPVLRGGASVALFPTGRVSLDDVSLGDNRTGAPALVAEHVVARLRFFPFLVGRIEIADVSLVRPTISIVFEDDRSSNWSGHIEALAQNLQRQPGPAASFSEIRIEDGTIILRDQANRVVETLSHVEFALAWPSISRSFAATGGFAWRDEQMAASISLTDFVAALQGDRSGLKIRLAGAPLKFGYDGYISHRPTLRMEGTVAADAASLRDTIRWAGRQPPPGGGFGRFALKAQANVVGGNIGLSRAHVELDDNIGEGVLSLNSHRALQGTLATESLDLTPYISTVRLLSGAGEHGWDGNPITLDGIEGIDTDLRLSAARVTVANARLGRTAVAATLHGGQFTVAIGESEAFGGVVRGTLGIAKSTNGADFKAQLQFLNVDLEQCIGELLGIRRLEGKGNLGFAVESTGASVYALAKGLNGTATLSSRKGAITGLNVEQLLKRIERRPLSGAGDFRVGKTPYESLLVNLKIADGIANVEDMRMEGAVVGLGLSGIASIPAREVDLRGTASLLQAGVAGQGVLPTFELPFMVQGPWNDPIMLPDAQSLIQRSGAAAPLLDAVRNRGTADAVRSVIERLRVPVKPPSQSPDVVPTLAGNGVPTAEAEPAPRPTAADKAATDGLPTPQ